MKTTLLLCVGFGSAVSHSPGGEADSAQHSYAPNGGVTRERHTRWAGHTGPGFSLQPLLTVAAPLLGGRLTASLGPGLQGSRPRTGTPWPVPGLLTGMNPPQLSRPRA